MVLEVHTLEGCQFPMSTNVHRYFPHMGNKTHGTWFAVFKVNLPAVFTVDHLAPIFVVELFIDKVIYCSGVNLGVDCA